MNPSELENSMENKMELEISMEMENPTKPMNPIQPINSMEMENPMKLENSVQNPTKNIHTESPKIIKDEVIKIEEIMPQPINNSKTRVELTINGNKDNVHWIKVAKPSNCITLNDIKLLLMRKPKMYGMSNEMEYYYLAKAINDGKAGFEHIDEDDSILPLFGGKIELQCWSR